MRSDLRKRPPSSSLRTSPPIGAVVMLAHLPPDLIYAGLCSLPLLIWLPLVLWADDHPRRRDDPPDSDDGEESLPALPTMAECPS